MQVRKNLNLPCFGRALPKSKKEDFKKTAYEAKEALGIDNGLSVLQIHSASMPRQDFFDTGIGKLNSDSALDFIDKMTFYTDTNAIKEFSIGETKDIGIPYFCPYLRSATTYGEDLINLLNIVQNKKTYGNILNAQDIMFLRDEKSDYVNYKNELSLGTNQPILLPLKTAYKRFKLGYSTSEFNEEFEEFKNTKRVKENYPRFALYPYIGKIEPDLFENFEYDTEKQEKFAKYKKMYEQEIEFYQFRQFLAKKEHDEAKKKINDKGINLFGDCLIGFSDAEVWANPDAFEKGVFVGLPDWGLPALKFDNILDENSESHKVFDDKVSFFLENYDGIRFDVGWCYAISQVGTRDQDFKDMHRVDLGHNLFDFINKRAKEIKGNDYDTKNLAYETDGAMFDWVGEYHDVPSPRKNIRNIVNICTTEWQHLNGAGWGYPYFLYRTGINSNEFILGTNNHDGENLKRLATNDDDETYEKRVNNSIVLNRIFKIPVKNLINNSKEFIKAKFAELFIVKNQFLFFIDVFGFDNKLDTNSVNPEDYTFRLSKDYENQYHSALQNGEGFNLMESLALVMKTRNLDKTQSDLYKKVLYYADYLRQKGAKTEYEADLEELNRLI